MEFLYDYISICSDGLNGMLSVWCSLEEDLVVVLVLVRAQVRASEPEIWMIRCGSSFH